jgi:hypothetical protein
LPFFGRNGTGKKAKKKSDFLSPEFFVGHFIFLVYGQNVLFESFFFVFGSYYHSGQVLEGKIGIINFC